MSTLNQRTARDDAPVFDPQNWENDCFYLSQLERAGKQRAADPRNYQHANVDYDRRGAYDASRTAVHVLPQQPHWAIRMLQKLPLVGSRISASGRSKNEVLLMEQLAAETPEQLEAGVRRAIAAGNGELAALYTKEMARRRMTMSESVSVSRASPTGSRAGSPLRQHSPPQGGAGGIFSPVRGY